MTYPYSVIMAVDIHHVLPDEGLDQCKKSQLPRRAIESWNIKPLNTYLVRFLIAKSRLLPSYWLDLMVEPTILEPEIHWNILVPCRDIVFNLFNTCTMYHFKN
jgi:hypothetical protein